MRDSNRLIYLLFIILSFLIFLRCSTTSNTTRYDDNNDQKYSDDEKHRFSSYDDERSITAGEDDYTDYGWDESDVSATEVNIDVTAIVEKYNLSEVDYNNDTTTLKEKVLLEIIRYLDTPYKYGGTSSDGIDCSAFTQNIFKSTLSTDLLRSASDQYSQGEIVGSKDALQFGDLVFFDTQRGISPGHVGIYIGDELFAHASTTKGVTISSMNQSYYESRYVGAKRIEPEGTF